MPCCTRTAQQELPGRHAVGRPPGPGDCSPADHADGWRVRHQTGQSKGSSLWLTLPLDPEHLEHQTSDLDSPLKGARVLVVDDNDTCRKVLVQQCTAWGLNVNAAASGKEALALLRTKAHLRDYFDIVLLDQNMPGMTGMQLAAKIKEDPSLNHDILLVMLTGISNAPSKIIARNCGIKRILAKPVAGYTLKTTLADELTQRNKGQVHQQQSRSRHPDVPTTVPGTSAFWWPKTTTSPPK
jgi:two-component system, sensor histidine kinase RetS